MSVTLTEGAVISNGSLKSSDVVCEMVRAAEHLSEELARCNRISEADEITELCDNVRQRMLKDKYDESEDSMYDWEELMKLLQDFAPEGCVVGGHEGDPSCIGIWRISE